MDDSENVVSDVLERRDIAFNLRPANFAIRFNGFKIWWALSVLDLEVGQIDSARFNLISKLVAWTNSELHRSPYPTSLRLDINIENAFLPVYNRLRAHFEAVLQFIRYYNFVEPCFKKALLIFKFDNGRIFRIQNDFWI
jgi:hypothetical protein